VGGELHLTWPISKLENIYINVQVQLCADACERWGNSGLDQLSRLDARLSAYRDTLFRKDAGLYDRDKQTKEEVAKVDASIEGFLFLLSVHFLQPGAFKTLEYLLRRYR
jgi:hypothetical protein